LTKAAWQAGEVLKQMVPGIQKTAELVQEIAASSRDLERKKSILKQIKSRVG
jgi:hypothetical protein